MKLQNIFLSVFFVLFLIVNSLPAKALNNREDALWKQKPYDVFSVGAATMDTFFKISDEEFKRFLSVPYNVKKGEMISIGKNTFLDLVNKTSPSAVLPSNSASNIIVNLANLGAKVSYNAIITNNSSEKELTEYFKKAGVMNFIHPKNYKNNTSQNLIYITPDGERTILHYQELHDSASQLDIDYHYIKDYKLLFTDAAIWDRDGQLSKNVLRSYKYAKKVGTIRAFSLHDVFFINKHRSEFQDLLNDLDIVFGNEKEALALFNVSKLEDAIRGFQQTVPIAIITQAAEGALIITPEQIIKVERAPLQNGSIVDKSGAGDAFAAGFLYGYINQCPLEKCGKIASFAAREALKEIGSRPNLKFDDILKEL